MADEKTAQVAQLPVATRLSPEHLEQLLEARQCLEVTGFATRMSQLIGTPVERALDLLPDNIQQSLSEITSSALQKALDTAIYSLGKKSSGSRHSNLLHKTTAAISGAVGGAFGLPALAVELPVSTTVILRSIADIARSEGEDLTQEEVQLACLQVFALGSSDSRDDGAETSYFGIRTALAKLITDSSRQLAAGVSSQSAGVLQKLLQQIAARFSAPVAQKFAAQAMPVVGAVGGATVNTLFIDHFQTVARGHFIVRRLERIYGKELVHITYLSLHPAG